MRKKIAERYRGRGVPRNFWLGVSTEDNRVAARLNVMRRLKDQVGEFTAFASVEPIIGPTDQLDLTGMDWVLRGGEGGPGARRMEFAWLAATNDECLSTGRALHFKQYGKAQNNPAVQRIMEKEGLRVTAAFAEAVRRKLERAPEEKGGATYKGAVFQQKPKAYHELRVKLNDPRLAI